MSKKRPRNRKPNTRARSEPLRSRLATIIQDDYVARRSSDATARRIIALLRSLPPSQVFLGLATR